jgi:hypothetical protein
MITFRLARVIPRLIFITPAVVLLAALGLGSPAAARSIRFLPLSEEIAERKIGLQDGGKITELKELNPRKRSAPHGLAKGDVPPSLVALDRQRPMGKPSGVEIILGKDLKSPLVLILEDTAHASGLRVVVMDDAEEGFPWGALRFVNLADKPLMVRCEAATKSIPKAFGIIDLTPGGDARNLGVQLFSEKEPDAVLYSAVWEHDPKLRKLIFIMPGENQASQELTLNIIPQDQRAKDTPVSAGKKTSR